MSKTGTYIVQDGKVVKISDEVPVVAHRDCWMPKGDLPYYDKSARCRFESRAQKRGWLQQHGMREVGLVNADQAPD